MAQFVRATTALLAALCVFGTTAANAAAALTSSELKIERAGKALAIAMPVIAGGITLAHDWDWTGAKELTADTVLTLGTALVLEKLVHERRPDHSDFKSFPSDTAALAFAPAAYLWDRYGWEYGVPGYVAAEFVSYSRIQAKKHHIWDTVASGLIATGYSHFVTTRYHRNNFYSELSASPDGAYFKLAYQF